MIVEINHVDCQTTIEMCHGVTWPIKLLFFIAHIMKRTR